MIRRARQPRAYSWTTTARTKAATQYIASASGRRAASPSASSTTSVTIVTASGPRSTRRRFATVARRHGTTGPSPDSSARTSASGTV